MARKKKKRDKRARRKAASSGTLNAVTGPPGQMESERKSQPNIEASVLAFAHEQADQKRGVAPSPAGGGAGETEPASADGAEGAEAVGKPSTEKGTGSAVDRATGRADPSAQSARETHPAKPGTLGAVPSVAEDSAGSQSPPSEAGEPALKTAAAPCSAKGEAAEDSPDVPSHVVPSREQLQSLKAAGVTVPDGYVGKQVSTEQPEPTLDLKPASGFIEVAASGSLAGSDATAEESAAEKPDASSAESQTSTPSGGGEPHEPALAVSFGAGGPSVVIDDDYQKQAAMAGPASKTEGVPDSASGFVLAGPQEAESEELLDPTNKVVRVPASTVAGDRVGVKAPEPEESLEPTDKMERIPASALGVHQIARKGAEPAESTDLTQKMDRLPFEALEQDQSVVSGKALPPLPPLPKLDLKGAELAPKPATGQDKPVLVIHPAPFPVAHDLKLTVGSLPEAEIPSKTAEREPLLPPPPPPPEQAETGAASVVADAPAPAVEPVEPPPPPPPEQAGAGTEEAAVKPPAVAVEPVEPPPPPPPEQVGAGTEEAAVKPPVVAVEPVKPPPPPPEEVGAGAPEVEVKPLEVVVEPVEPLPPPPVEAQSEPSAVSPESPVPAQVPLEPSLPGQPSTDLAGAPAAERSGEEAVPLSMEESIEAKLLSKARRESPQARAVSGELSVAPAPEKQSTPKPVAEERRSVEVSGAERAGSKWTVGSETLRHSLVEDIRFELGFDGDSPPPADTGLKGEQLELSSPDDITGVHPREAFSDLERAFFEEQLDEEEDTFEDLFAEVPEPPTVWEWFRTRGKGAEKGPSTGGPSFGKRPSARPRPPTAKRAAPKKTGPAKRAGAGGRKKSPTSKSSSSARGTPSGKQRPRKPRKK